VRRRRPIPAIRSAAPSSTSQGTSNPVFGRPPVADRVERDEAPEERAPEVEDELPLDDELPLAGGPGVSEGPPEPDEPVLGSDEPALGSDEPVLGSDERALALGRRDEER
jgi:hypothetical protein